MRGPIVIALGGNAISPAGERDTIENQFHHTSETASRIVRLVEAGWERLAITHGNGPQVGNVATRVELARDVAPWLPLYICVADTQGGMGLMIQQCLRNALQAAGIERSVATVVTQVEVDASDPAFTNPTKPIGPARRLVASPIPLRVVEADTIGRLVDAGVIVVCAGGGGVPVARTPKGLSGVEAVVDKDLTSALLAKEIGAETLVILTDVEGVTIGRGGTEERLVSDVGVVEMRERLRAGEFPPGSMGPKVEAACNFVESGGALAVIASLDRLEEAVEGSAGTRIHGG